MKKFAAAISLSALALLALADICIGDAGFGLDVPDAVLWKLRIPRMLTAMLAGAALSLCGTQMQAVFRNPLADPHIMGVSAGAGTGAAVATLAIGPAAGMLSGVTIMASAFGGAMLAALIIIAVSARCKDAGTLLIFGVLLGFIFSAATSIMEYSAAESSLKLFYNWSAGSFSGNSSTDIAILALVLVIGIVPALLSCRKLDLMLFGDEYAEMAGAEPSRTRALSLTFCCLMTGAVTAICGPLGFVGILAPHAARMLLGSAAHKRVIPAAMALGAAAALAADCISNALPTPVPAGSTMAVIGIPAVALILFTRRKVQ